MSKDYFGARDTLQTSHGDYIYYRLEALERKGLRKLARLPFSIRVLLESVLRNCDGREVTEAG